MRFPFRPSSWLARTAWDQVGSLSWPRQNKGRGKEKKTQGQGPAERMERFSIGGHSNQAASSAPSWSPRLCLAPVRLPGRAPPPCHLHFEPVGQSRRGENLFSLSLSLFAHRSCRASLAAGAPCVAPSGETDSHGPLDALLCTGLLGRPVGPSHKHKHTLHARRQSWAPRRRVFPIATCAPLSPAARPWPAHSLQMGAQCAPKQHTCRHQFGTLQHERTQLEPNWPPGCPLSFSLFFSSRQPASIAPSVTRLPLAAAAFVRPTRSLPALRPI